MSVHDRYNEIQNIRAIRTENACKEAMAIIQDAIAQSTTARIRTKDLQILPVQTAVRGLQTTLEAPKSMRTRLLRLATKSESFLRSNNSLTSAKLETVKVATLQTINQSNIGVTNTQALRQAVSTFSQAKTPTQIVATQKQLIGIVYQEHRLNFIDTLATAARIASTKIGFNIVKTDVTPHSTRVVATNQKGVTLVSEIAIDEKQNIKLESEVDGLIDNSCVQVIDAFNRELRLLGVVAAPPRRTTKPPGHGGVMASVKERRKERVAIRKNNAARRDSERVQDSYQDTIKHRNG